MNELKEAELNRNAARDAVGAQLSTIKTVESRLAQIDSDLQKIDEKLVDEAVTNNQGIDWAGQATARLGLELEKTTLPAIISRLKEKLPELQAAAQRATREIDLLMKENSEAGLVVTIRKLLAEGKTQRIVQSECGLVEHDFYRILAIAKRA